MQASFILIRATKTLENITSKTVFLTQFSPPKTRPLHSFKEHNTSLQMVINRGVKYDLKYCLFQLAYADDFAHVMACDNIFITSETSL